MLNRRIQISASPGKFARLATLTSMSLSRLPPNHHPSLDLPPDDDPAQLFKERGTYPQKFPLLNQRSAAAHLSLLSLLRRKEVPMTVGRKELAEMINTESSSKLGPLNPEYFNRYYAIDSKALTTSLLRPLDAEYRRKHIARKFDEFHFDRPEFLEELVMQCAAAWAGPYLHALTGNRDERHWEFEELENREDLEQEMGRYLEDNYVQALDDAINSEVFCLAAR